MLKYPDASINNYYEYSSADGFAFAGAALAMQQQSSNEVASLLEEVDKRNWRLNATIGINKVPVTINNDYVYTLWTCAEFFYILKDKQRLREVANRIDAIGRYNYPINLVRYCSEEVNYVVPNVTSAAILVYTMVGRHGKAKKLLDIFLQQQQPNGNWQYATLVPKTGLRYTVFEDCYHLSMILYHLRAANKINPQLKIHEATTRIMTYLLKNKPRCTECRRSKNSWLCEGSIGWGIPMMFLGTYGLVDSKKHIQGLIKTTSYLNHPNFRVRSMSMWALERVNYFCE